MKALLILITHAWNAHTKLIYSCVTNRKKEKYANLQAVASAHPQAPHPHVSEQHLAASVGNKVPMLGGHGKLQAGGVAPIFQLIRQELHGHLLIMFVRLIQQFISQLTKLPERKSHWENSQTTSLIGCSWWSLASWRLPYHSPGVVFQVLIDVIYQLTLR